MRHFLLLVHFEMNRFFKLYMTLIIVVFLMQLAVVLMKCYQFVQLIKSVTKDGRVTPEQFNQEYGPFYFLNVVESPLFIIPIIIGIGALLFYMFFIWYRDWFAKNTFIYRLLMLPTNRMNIFYAKLTTIILTIFGLLAAQIIMFAFYTELMTWMIPQGYRVDVPIGMLITSSLYLQMIIPGSVSGFFITYVLGFTFIIVLFTAILFERSFKQAGLILGIIYIGLTFSLLIAPFLIQIVLFQTFYLYVDEMFYLETALIALVIGISLFISHHLIHKKITV